MTAVHSLHSSLRETILEHLITGEILRRLWRRQIYDAEILHSEFDAGGYDMVLCHRQVTRHIQLKASRINGSTRNQKIHTRLFERPAGCVIWIVTDDELKIDHYLWLDMRGLNPQDFKTAKHTKGNSEGTKAERPAIRIVPKSHFMRLSSFDDLLNLLLVSPTLTDSLITSG